MRSPYWPLFGLRITTPQLEMRPPSDDDLAALAAGGRRRARAGLHAVLDPLDGGGTGDSGSQHLAVQLAAAWRWKPEDWHLTLVTLVDGEVVGNQGIGAASLAIAKTVETGSWVGLRHQGQGIAGDRAPRCCTSRSRVSGPRSPRQQWEDNARPRHECGDGLRAERRAHRRSAGTRRPARPPDFPGRPGNEAPGRHLHRRPRRLPCGVRHLTNQPSAAELRRHLLCFARLNTGAAARRTPEPVPAMARDDVHVEVGDALAHPVVHRHERAIGPEPDFYRGSDALRRARRTDPACRREGRATSRHGLAGRRARGQGTRAAGRGTRPRRRRRARHARALCPRRWRRRDTTPSLGGSLGTLGRHRGIMAHASHRAAAARPMGRGGAPAGCRRHVGPRWRASQHLRHPRQPSEADEAMGGVREPCAVEEQPERPRP